MSSYVIRIIIEEAFSKRHWQNSSISLNKVESHAHVETILWPEESVQDDCLLPTRIYSLELGLRLPVLKSQWERGWQISGKKGERGLKGDDC